MTVERSDPDHEHLVEPEGGDLADAVVVSLEQGLAVGDAGVVDGVSVTPELPGQLVDTPGMLADLERRPPGGPGGEELSGTGDPVVLLSLDPPTDDLAPIIHAAI